MAQARRIEMVPPPEPLAKLKARLDDLRALIPEIPAWPPAGGVEGMALTLLELLERKQRHLIEDNVRLAALRELTETLLRDPEEERVLRTLSLYFRHAYSLDEVMILSRVDGGGLRGYRARLGGGALCEAVRWSRETLRGTAWEEALAGRSVRPEDSPDAPAGTPAPLPVILPLLAGGDGHGPQEERKEPEPAVMGLLALRPDGLTGAGTDHLQVEQLAFQAATLLESVRNHRRTARERRFREGLLEAMEDGLIATDGEGRLTAANRAALAMLGEHRDSILGRPLETLSPISPRLVAHCRTALEHQARVTQQEATLNLDGEKIPISVSAVPLGVGEEEWGGVVATFTDLRPLRSIEEELRRMDRLAALGRFASAVAHEIRNPLAAIGAGVEFLSGSIPAERQDDVGFIRAEVARLDRIVRDLLEPARMQPLAREPIEVRRLVSRACQATEPQARDRGIQFALRQPVEEEFRAASVEADLDRMLQVLVNVVRNAIEASPPDGEVTIGWQTDRWDPDPITRIWVEDKGPGIPPEHLTHIFEPFYSTKPTGTGLGLYVCRGVVDQHGGTMQVEIPPAGGTRITITLPGTSQ